MEKLFYLLKVKGNIKIDISKYVTYHIKQKDGIIYLHIDNHGWSDNQHRTVLSDKRDVKKFFDKEIFDKYIKRKIDDLYNEYVLFQGNALREKLLLLTKVESNSNYNMAKKDTISRIVNLICSNNRFYLKNTSRESIYLTLADSTNKGISPYSELHIQLVKRHTDSKGINKIEYPDLCKEEVLSLLSKSIKENPHKIYKQLLIQESLCKRMKEKREDDFEKIEANYIKRPAPYKKRVEQIIEA